MASSHFPFLHRAIDSTFVSPTGSSALSRLWRKERDEEALGFASNADTHHVGNPLVERHAPLTWERKRSCPHVLAFPFLFDAFESFMPKALDCPIRRDCHASAATVEHTSHGVGEDIIMTSPSLFLFGDLPLTSSFASSSSSDSSLDSCHQLNPTSGSRTTTSTSKRTHPENLNHNLDDSFISDSLFLPPMEEALSPPSPEENRVTLKHVPVEICHKRNSVGEAGENALERLRQLRRLHRSYSTTLVNAPVARHKTSADCSRDSRHKRSRLSASSNFNRVRDENIDIAIRLRDVRDQFRAIIQDFDPPLEILGLVHLSYSWQHRNRNRVGSIRWSWCSSRKTVMQQAKVWEGPHSSEKLVCHFLRSDFSLCTPRYRYSDAQTVLKLHQLPVKELLEQRKTKRDAAKPPSTEWLMKIDNVFDYNTAAENKVTAPQNPWNVRLRKVVV